MAGQINARRGATGGDGTLLVFYNFIRSPFLYMVTLLLSGIVFYGISRQDSLDIVVVADTRSNNANGLRSKVADVVTTEPAVTTTIAAEEKVTIASETMEITKAPENTDTINAEQEIDQKSDEKGPEPEQANTSDPDPSLITLNREYLDHLRTLDPLPHKVHILFPDRNYDENNKDMPFVQHSIIALKNLNPEWNVTVYDNNDVDDIIRSAGRSGLISQQEADILVGASTNGTEAAHIVERSDIARLILMYTEGGFYLDADRLVTIPMSKILTPDVKLCLPTHDDVNFCQDLQCTSPKNKLFLSMIQVCSNIRMKKGPDGGPLERRKGWSKGGALFDMGPVVYNRNILNTVFEDVTYDNIDQKGGYKKARESLINSDGLILTKQDATMNGLLLDNSIQAVSRDSLYAKYGMKSWAPAVNAVWEAKR